MILPELVFGLVAPIGVDISLLQHNLISGLKVVGYTPHLIHLTELLLDSVSVSSATETEDLRKDIDAKIELGNQARAIAGPAAVVALGISEIQRIRGETLSRTDQAGDSQQQAEGHAYIIRQLKRPEEVNLLRKVYGEKFVQISATLGVEGRIENLKTRILRDNPADRHPERTARDLIIRDEEEGDITSGQRLRDAFHTADVFIDTSTDRTSEQTILRFINALFGKNSIGPLKDEFGANLASTASLRSVDLSRQVGAAILTSSGDVVALGCNEVPKAGGGNYWEDDHVRARDVDVHRETNKQEINQIIYDIVKRMYDRELINHGSGPDGFMAENTDLFNESRLGDLTEFGRMTHAEMSALCDAARLGRPTSESTLYVTTFPCHNCTKHIVAAGIRRVVYIEPYAKSRASTMQFDSINIGGSNGPKVSFEHFTGISPRRFQSIFKKGRRRDGVKIREWCEGRPAPLVADRSPGHIKLEPYAIEKILLALQNNPLTHPSSTPR